MNQTLRIGLLYPLHSAEDDYPRMAETLKPPVEVYIAHTDSPNLHRIQESRITGSREYLMAGVDELRDRGVAACMWACTSGSFAFGLEGARLQVEPITEELGVPASSTSLAFLNAAQTLGLQRVAVAATEQADIAALGGELDHNLVGRRERSVKVNDQTRVGQIAAAVADLVHDLNVHRRFLRSVTG